MIELGVALFDRVGEFAERHPLVVVWCCALFTVFMAATEAPWYLVAPYPLLGLWSIGMAIAQRRRPKREP